MATPLILDLDANDSSGAPGADFQFFFEPCLGPVPISDLDTLITGGEPTLQRATITLLNPIPGDFLESGALPAGITAAPFDPETGVLTLVGDATRADYQTAILAVRLGSQGVDWDSNRRMTVQVQDAAGDWSNTALSLDYGNRFFDPSPPLLDLDADSSTAPGADYTGAFQPGQGGVPIADDDPHIYLFPVDCPVYDPAIEMVIIQLSNACDGDALRIDLPNPWHGITASYDSYQLSLTLSGEASAGDYESAIRAVRFDNPGADPTPISREIAVQVFDNGRGSGNVAIARIVFPPPDPVILDGDARDNDLRGDANDDRIAGRGGNDTILGFGGNDVIRGGGGDDLLAGGPGNDHIWGGAGVDTASFVEAGDGVTADLRLGTATGGDGSDTLGGIERLLGGRWADRLLGDQTDDRLCGDGGNDRLVGRHGGDRLFGGRGDDVVVGGGGADVLGGGVGNDTLTGGAGADTFRFHVQPLPGNQDSITDFNPAEDLIDLGRGLFTGIATPGPLSADAFGKWGAADADDRVLHDRATGTLVYDPDGSGPEMAVIFASVQPGLVLTHLSFVVT